MEGLSSGFFVLEGEEGEEEVPVAVLELVVVSAMVADGGADSYT